MRSNINNMDRNELIELVKMLIAERESKQTYVNKVVVCDVEVESNVASLESCKLIVNDLIKTNDDFITARKNKIIKDNWGYIG